MADNPQPPPDSPAALNPYEVTRLTDPNDAPPAAHAPPAERTYRIHMDWPDRRRFMKAVGLLRLVACVGGLFGLLSVFAAIGSLFELLRVGNDNLSANAELFARLLVSLLKIGVAVYLFWLQWKLADAIAQVSGGSAGKMTAWSQIQLRIAQLGIAMFAIAIAEVACNTFLAYYVSHVTFGR